MATPKKITLRLNANVEQYEVAVYDCCNVLKERVFTRQACLCLCLSSPCVRVVATPLSGASTTKLYFWLDVACQTIFDLYFSFPPLPTPTAAIQRFTLTDSAYGLPIDGSLLFTQV